MSQAAGVPGELPLWLGWLDCVSADDATALAVLGQSRASLKIELHRKTDQDAQGESLAGSDTD